MSINAGFIYFLPVAIQICFIRFQNLVAFYASWFSVWGYLFDLSSVQKMKENPIIQSPSLSPAPMWEAPFLAMTICPQVNDEFTDFALNKTNWPEFAQSFVPDNL